MLLYRVQLENTLRVLPYDQRESKKKSYIYDCDNVVFLTDSLKVAIDFGNMLVNDLNKKGELNINSFYLYRFEIDLEDKLLQKKTNCEYWYFGETTSFLQDKPEKIIADLTIQNIWKKVG